MGLAAGASVLLPQRSAAGSSTGPLLIHIQEASWSDQGSRALHREGSDLCFAQISSEHFASFVTFIRGEPVGNSDAARVTFRSKLDEKSAG